ncbi:MAG: prolipoprotein diacylglyceryl transferase [Candidatus Komeilibacteria bacterium]|nr:prolipoprotein diacylglyceryl transferase [Candidatus Komeilibacteria bacterium]
MFWQTYVPEPVFFSVAGWPVYWYGLIMLVAIVAAYFVSRYFVRRAGIEIKQWDNLIFYTLIGGFIGARLYDVLLELSYYQQNPGDIFKVWQGGLAIHGGIIGGAIAVYIICRKYNWSFWRVADWLAVALPLGQAIGRWGNYFNQELYGRPTDSAFGIFIEAENRVSAYEGSALFHPTFLYESVLNLLLFVGLFWAQSKANFKTGMTIGLYLTGYGFIRFFLEMVKIDQTPIYFGLRWPQWFSILIVAVGVGITIYKRRDLPNPKKSV